mgnify:CR=1 FL=1
MAAQDLQRQMQAGQLSPQQVCGVWFGLVWFGLV